MASTEAADALRTLAKRPAVVTIDLHRGHLDPEVATLPLPADNAAELGVPIVHVITAYRNRDEILDNAYWRFQADRRGSSRAAVAEHNLEGMPGLELMPGIGRDGDAIVRTKQRYDCFVGTDLEMVLRAGRHDAVLVLGVNTNSCVIATAIAASVRDYAVFVVEEGVDTMLGPELHDAALSVIAASFGWVVPAQVTLDALGARDTRTVSA
jgi:biuret amidohydrolase